MQQQHFAVRFRYGLALLLTMVIGLGLTQPALADPVWQIRTLEPHDGTGTSLVLDSQGNPVVSYYNGGSLKLVDCDNPTCAGNITIRAQDSFLGSGLEASSLALDSKGNPVISYYDNASRDLKLAGTKRQVVDDGLIAGLYNSPKSDVGQYNSLGLDSSDNPVISYYDATNLDLRVVHCGNPTCSSGNTIKIVDSPGRAGQYNSLVMNSSGYPVISYYDASNGDLKLAYCNNATCSAAGWVPVDETGNVGQYTSLALDSRGNPVISYYAATNGDLKLAKCGNPTCSSGNTITIVDSAGTVGRYSSLALDSHDNPVISYFDATNSDLKLVRCGNPTCSSGNAFKIVDSAGTVGEYTALALDSSGYAVISYTAINGVKLAREDVPPSVTINQATGQTDPTTSNTVLFNAVFSEAVTGFTPGDVTLSGTANLANATVAVSGGPTTYLITVSGALGDGTVIAALGANVVTDTVGSGNPASTSTDNRVTVIASPIVAWGNNSNGESSVPAGLQASAVSGGRWHSLALKGDRTVVAWGCSGTGNYGQCDLPAGLSGVTAISAGLYQSLALKADGTVVAWGCGGTGNYGQCTVPTGLSGVKTIAAGTFHSLALKQDGTVVAWGCSDATLNRGQCTIPAGLSGVKAIAAGFNHSLALKQDGTVVAWGNNTAGESRVPTGLSGVIAIAAGSNFSLALKQDGTIVAWGDNLAGQRNIPAGLNGVTAIVAGNFHSLALKQDGTVVAWGCGGTFNHGQCSVPAGLGGVTAISAGSLHSLALGSLSSSGVAAASAGADPRAVATTEVTAAPAMVDPASQTQRLFLPVVIKQEAAASASSADAATTEAQTAVVAAPAVLTTTLPVTALAILTPTQALSPLAAVATTTASVPVTVETTPVVTATFAVSTPTAFTAPVVVEPTAITTTQPATTSAVDAAADVASSAPVTDTNTQNQQLFLPFINNASDLAGAALGSFGSATPIVFVVLVLIGGIVWVRQRRSRR